jgi:hypothetical protein
MWKNCKKIFNKYWAEPDSKSYHKGDSQWVLSPNLCSLFDGSEDTKSHTVKVWIGEGCDMVRNTSPEFFSAGTDENYKETVL